MKKNLVLHPFLFALFPIIFQFSNNIKSLFITDILFPITVLFLFTALSLLLLQFILKDIQKAGIIISLFLLFIFSYGYIYTFIKNLDVGDARIL